MSDKRVVMRGDLYRIKGRGGVVSGVASREVKIGESLTLVDRDGNRYPFVVTGIEGFTHRRESIWEHAVGLIGRGLPVMEATGCEVLDDAQDATA